MAPAGRSSACGTPGGICTQARRCHPFAVDVKIDGSIENVKCFGVLAMQVQTKCKFALEIVFHQGVRAAGVGGGDLDEGVIAGPVVIRSGARRNESLAQLRHESSLR